MSKEAGTTGHGMSWLVPHQRAAHRHGKHQIRCITSGCITGKPVTAFLIFLFSMGARAMMLVCCSAGSAGTWRSKIFRE